MRRLVLIVFLSACTPLASPTPTVTPSTPATSSAAVPTVSAGNVLFPDLRLVAASSTGELYVLRNSQWVREAQVCPSGTATFSASIVDFKVSADGRRAWFRCDAAGPPGEPIHAFVYDFAGKAAREVTGASELGLGPISPDGRFVVLAALGDCPMPAPVCQSTRILVDLETQSRNVILPSAYWLSMEMRWTTFGLTYFMPECAPAGCTSPDKTGTFRWDGSQWTKISPYRLIDATATDRLLMESRRSLEVDQGAALVVERLGTSERVLTSSGLELGLSLDDRGATTFRLTAPGATGTYVRYEDGRESAATPGNFSPYLFTRAGDWIVSRDSAPGGATLWAYSISRRTIASRIAGISIVGLAALP
jgi:hypothetical protein